MFITHNLGVVAQIADEVYIMYLGKIVERLRQEIFHNPKHRIPWICCTPSPKSPANQRRLVAIEGGIPSPSIGVSGCPFHPAAAGRSQVSATSEFPKVTDWGRPFGRLSSLPQETGAGDINE
jgi:ABC-type dipeptide/oligopeptide/nickel transport system ATPase component